MTPKQKGSPKLRRPIPPPANAVTRSALSKEVKAGTKSYIRFIYYYSAGWFGKLDETDAWTMKEAMIHTIISFINLSNHESLAQDDDPRSLRLVAKYLRGPRVIGFIAGLADTLDARAEALEIEDTKTEATD